MAVFLWTMIPCMANRRQRLFVAGGPVAAFAALLAYCAKANWPLGEMLPVYCSLYVAVSLGMVGHRKALRAYMLDRAKDPTRPEDGTATPWILQMAFTLPVFLGASLWYVTGT
ncbi:hypothetical protein EF910_06520 [Streptomyces sp. WAC07149]|uniref:hypothetical protein n=1 Tax=Streptomyces sp. WAC07149 TaxID=2487425 RepID=UPI000F78E2CC|nr:hypothetical protein [Streptomyces sp. WAC07149]RST07333.1 hypothetical protein EF910_06520 [Streptomyces sp. WAC07149]